MGGSSAIPCERKTRRRSMISPAGPTRGNSAVQPPPCPPPRAGEGIVTSPSPIHCGEKIQGRQVALKAKARDHALCGRGRDHPVPVRLARADIRAMAFDDPLARAAQLLGERQAVVAGRARLDADGVACRAFRFYPSGALTLV